RIVDHRCRGAWSYRAGGLDSPNSQKVAAEPATLISAVAASASRAHICRYSLAGKRVIGQRVLVLWVLGSGLTRMFGLASG
ncbi:MAG: hypothetical protein ACXVKQ_21090, partial [Acidimicrobiia bacterium]